MIASAMQFVKELAEKAARDLTVDIDGRTYATEKLILMPEPEPPRLEMHTLGGFVTYINERASSDFGVIHDDGDAPMTVSVHSHDEVVLSTPVLYPSHRRVIFAECSMFKGIDRFPFGQFVDLERFVIAMQSSFVPDETTAMILKLVGNVKAEAVRQTSDDGVTQTVVAKSGVAKVEQVEVPNPVTLRPFRTFAEVEQPASQYVLRMRGGGEGATPVAALFEFSDGHWQLECVRRIAEYLRENIERPEVSILA